MTWMISPEDIPLKMEAALDGSPLDEEKVLYFAGYGLNKSGAVISLIK